MPGMKWSPPSLVTRVTGPQVVSLVDLLITMSLAGQPDWKRQSCQTTYAVPAESTSAEGSGSLRRFPATAWSWIVAISTEEFQVEPPFVDRNERIWPLLLSYGTRTVPLGRTTGWPPRPVALVECTVQEAPPLVEVAILTALPAPLSSYSV